VEEVGSAFTRVLIAAGDGRRARRGSSRRAMWRLAVYHGGPVVPRSTMSATTSLQDPVATGVELVCVEIVAWIDGRPWRGDEARLQAEPIKKAVVTGQPIWVQLALPRLSDDEQSWFEGSVDPWGQELEAPEVDWTRVDGVLDAVGIAPPVLDRHERRLLERLPYLYGRGVSRVAREVWGSRSRAPAPLRFFPTVAFRPIEQSDPPRFRTVRATVGVIRNVVVTVRLPDLWWNDEKCDGDEKGAFDYSPGGPLGVAQRFFPVADDLTADDVAEAIGLQQASTARAVSERVRTRLTKIERASRSEAGGGTLRDRTTNLAHARDVIDMTDTLYQLDRQLERLLRRVELNASDVVGRSSSSDIAVRYRFALDELRSLEGNGGLASQAISQAIARADQAEHERFEFVAAALASVILLPTLAATIYGANVALPAKNNWEGFIVMMLVIIAFAVLGLFTIAKALPRRAMPGAAVLLPLRLAASTVTAVAFRGRRAGSDATSRAAEA
jgi:CorA-like Mg2+ transporter protein